jgi:hypothetical protein
MTREPLVLTDVMRRVLRSIAAGGSGQLGDDVDWKEALDARRTLQINRCIKRPGGRGAWYITERGQKLLDQKGPA